MKRMKGFSICKSDTATILMSCSVVLCAFLVMLWRVMRGFDWSDDTYASAIVYRILQGDVLFKEIWDIHQFSAVILVPLFWIYTSIAGTKGLILFSRFIMVLTLSVEAICVFLKFRKNCGCLWSILASILLLSFGCNFGLTYNTMMIEAFILAFLFLPTSSDGIKREVCDLLSGFFSSIAIQAYPSTIIALFLFFVFIIKYEGCKRWKALAMYFGGCFIVVVRFIILLYANSSFENFINYVHYLFMDPEHTSGRFSIFNHIKSIIAMVKIPGVLIFIGYITAIISRFKKRINKKSINSIAILAMIVFIVVEGISSSRFFSEQDIKYHLYFSISLLFPVVWLLQGTKWDNLLLIWLGGVFASVAVNFATNNSASYYVYPYLFSAIATLLYIGKTLKATWKVDVLREKLLYSGTAAISFVMVLFIFFSGLCYVYRDDKLGTLDTQIKNGPAAGVFTSKAHAEQYQLTIDTIGEFMPQSGNVLYTKLLPFGYMLSDAKPATPRLWRTNLDYDMFEEYYHLNPQKTPDAIFIVNESFGITNGDIVIGDYMRQYIDETPHETIDFSCGKIIRFNNTSQFQE